jgi:hypothetical protein
LIKRKKKKMREESSQIQAEAGGGFFLCYTLGFCPSVEPTLVKIWRLRRQDLFIIGSIQSFLSLLSAVVSGDGGIFFLFVVSVGVRPSFFSPSACEVHSAFSHQP